MCYNDENDCTPAVPEFHFSLKEGDEYEDSPVALTSSKDAQKSKASNIFSNMINKLQSIRPKIRIYNMGLTVGDVCIVEIFFNDFQEHNKNNMKYFNKVYNSLDAVSEGIENDFNNLNEIEPIKKRRS